MREKWSDRTEQSRFAVSQTSRDPRDEILQFDLFDVFIFYHYFRIHAPVPLVVMTPIEAVEKKTPPWSRS